MWKCKKCNQELHTVYCPDSFRNGSFTAGVSRQDRARDISDRTLLRDLGFWFTMTNEKRAELHQKFFNDAVESIENKTLPELIAFEEELEEIILRGKAYAQAVSNKRRKITANLSESERDALVTQPDYLVSDALNLPKLRKARQTTADKVIDDLYSLGLDESTIKAMKGVMAPTHENPDVAKAVLRDLQNNTKPVFNGSPKPVISLCHTCGAKIADDDSTICAKCKRKKALEENNQPIDFSKLFGQNK